MLTASRHEAAECLAKNKSVIVADWMREVEEKLPGGNRNSRPAIKDHIPQLIDQLISCLTIVDAKYRDELIKLAKQHGRQRNSLQAYTIEQVVAEYRILRKKVLQTMAHDKNGFSLELQSVVSDFIDECIEVAVAEFSKLSQLEVEQSLAAGTKTSEELRLKQIDLEQALRVRDEFLSIASHELKTPLTALILRLQLLERSVRQKIGQPVSAADVSASLVKSVGQATRLNEMVDRLLDLSRIRNNRFSLEIVTVELCALVKDVISRMSAQLSAAKLDIDLTSCAEAIVYVDPLRIEQVLTNLISNAIKYGAGKPITIELSKLPDSVKIAVTDRGIGISKEDQKIIFERFVRATDLKSSESMGLGLYIAYQIVNAHGGTIEVISELGQGTTFSVILPAKRIVNVT